MLKASKSTCKMSFSAAEREKNAKLTRDLKEAREETSQIRANTQQIISTYQNSEEVRSNALDGELKSLKEQFESMKTQRDEFDAELTANRQNLDRLTNQLTNAENKVPTFLSLMISFHARIQRTSAKTGLIFTVDYTEVVR